jgi:amino acid transporter
MSAPVVSARRISLFSAVNVVVASMVGAGVFTTSGFALADLGSPLLVLAAWCVGGLLAICGAVSYGALAERFSESGGEYLFLSRAIHPAAGNIAGYVSLLAGFTGAIAIAAKTFEEYAPGFTEVVGFPGGRTSGLTATILIVLGSLLHGLRLRAGSRVQDILVVIKIVMIAAFLLAAIFSLGQPWYGLATAEKAPAQWPIAAFAVTLMWISFSYSGFNAAIYITGEVHNSGATVRRALWMGTLLVTAIYLALNSVFVLAPPSEMVAGKKDIAAEAARFVGGERFQLLFRATILLSLATSVSSLMMTGPRVYAKMADDGVLPRWFRFKGEVPRSAIIAQGCAAIIVVQLTSLQELLSYLGLTLSLSAALTVSSLFVLRSRGEAVRVPFYPWPPLIFVSGTLLIAAIAGARKPTEFLVAVGTLAVGLLAYWLQSRSRPAKSQPQAPLH